MGTKKQTTDSKQTNEYKYMPPPTSPDISNVQATVNEGDNYDPGIIHQYGLAERDLRESYDNPMGGYANEQVKDAAQHDRATELNMRRDMALREGHAQSKKTQFARQYAVANLTKPPLVNSGSTGHETTKVSDPFGTAMSAVSAGASVFA